MLRRNFLKTFSAGAATSFLSVNPLFACVVENTELSYHTIEKVLIKNIEVSYPRHVGKNARCGNNHGVRNNVTVCELITNQGARGWGVPTWGESNIERKDYVIGKKVSDLFSPEIGLIDPLAAYSDIALHDLAGNILNKPVYELMGAKKPETTFCYSGMIYFDDLTSYYNKAAGLDIILNECQFDYDLGFRQFKLKIGRGNKCMTKSAGIQRDIDVTKLVANAFPDCDILVDGNDGFTMDEFVLYLKGIEGTNLFWIEEPFQEEIEDYKKLNSMLNDLGISALLADGEANPNHEILNELIEKKLLNVHLADIQALNIGYTGWRKLLPELKDKDVFGSPHAWGTQIKTNAIAHLAGAIGNIVTIEGVTNISDDVDLGNYKLENGKLIPSSSPGFGMKLLIKD